MNGEAGSNYHDISCRCPHHCENCFENLMTAAYPNPRTRYCSDHCKRHAARERQLDRNLRSAR
jgi:hypothetical protein